MDKDIVVCGVMGCIIICLFVTSTPADKEWVEFFFNPMWLVVPALLVYSSLFYYGLRCMKRRFGGGLEVLVGP